MKKKEFLRIRSIVDNFLIVDNKLDSKRFEYLFNIYGEDLTQNNESCLSVLSPDLLDGFYDSTLKHKVFNYFLPVEKFMARSMKTIAGKLNPWRGVNDLSTVIAGFFCDYEPHDDMVEDLEDHIKNFK